MAAPNLKASTLLGVQGKIALVTGGGSGIGTMIAATLVQNGAKVYIASRKEKQLKGVADALNKAGPGSCHYIVADLGTKAGCDALAGEFKKHESKLHILVNNSGATWGAPYDDYPENAWDKVMALNVKALFYLTVGLTDLLAKDAKNTDPGRVINIASVAGISPRAEGGTVSLAGKGNGLWAYNTSKAAAIHLSTQLAVTLAPRFITVNAICPGVFPSKMTAFGYKQAGQGAFDSVHPMGRAGSAEDIGGTVMWLATRAGAHITGNVTVLDGGLMITGEAAPKESSKL
ncbi:rhamnolipids biosynthesis 3-oxoacyl-reductase [Exidia glandulosa HHB12029]|uniref:Rhamnolipids biosynthesis 3-oxoacyl-reductase n=1 Tax=Exidia glandulosa HHB12029 TaxID=1314781 RepID=A0A165EGB9_EXIGL|nr:rhamnolipids biosynthesis 3-oxoacyl-reductase [Exidia glandulosa HHB12029]